MPPSKNMKFFLSVNTIRQAAKGGALEDADFKR